jgi:ribosomal protein S18 acetylase RimI-like enzyme
MAEQQVRRRVATSSDRKFISDLIAEGIGLYEDRLLPQLAQLEAVDHLIETTDTSIITVENHDAGYLAVRRTSNEIYVASLALLPRWRRRGIGTAPLEELAAEAAGTGTALRLAVRESNPARRLYERLGFKVVSSEGRSFEWNALRHRSDLS